MAEKELFSGRFDSDLLERLRNAVWHTGRGLTLTGIIEEAARKALEALEEQNGGKPFPPRKSELPKSPKKRKGKSKGKGQEEGEQNAP